MYDPDDNEVIVNEIFYDAVSEQKLGSKMGVFDAVKLPSAILQKSRKTKICPTWKVLQLERKLFKKYFVI